MMGMGNFRNHSNLSVLTEANHRHDSDYINVYGLERKRNELLMIDGGWPIILMAM